MEKLEHKNWYLCRLYGDELPMICRYNETIDMLAQVSFHSWGLYRTYHNTESMEIIETTSIKSNAFISLDKFLDNLK